MSTLAAVLLTMIAHLRSLFPICAEVSKYIKLLPLYSVSQHIMDVQDLSSWQAELDSDPTYKLASSALKRYNADNLLFNQTKDLSHYFSHVVKREGDPVTNQKSSGRCWLFASLNILRIETAEKLNLDKFELSQTYLFFYDKLEKANFFLDKIIETYEEDVNSRLIQHLLVSPVLDGGQFTMFINLIEKYGVVPIDNYPDVYSSTASRKLNDLLTSKLREFAEVLRDAKGEGKDVFKIKKEMMKEIYKYLTIFLGQPPSSSEEFSYEFYDKDKKYQKIKSTPLDFFKSYTTFKPETAISVINDPRHPYFTKLKIEHLNNITGGQDVEYLNLPNDILSDLIVKKIKGNKPVFFGSHTPKFMNKEKGLMDIKSFGYDLIGFKNNQVKASRVLYGESLMTHAMLITGVNINEDSGKPDRYRVENSWGKDSGVGGYYAMSQEYFEEYCFQIVVDKEELGEEYLKYWDQEPIILPLWDPMGALAE